MKLLLSALVISALMVMSLNAYAETFTFATGQYDNTANTVSGTTPVYNQTTGNFRDIIWWSINNGQPRDKSPDFINSGMNLVTHGIRAEVGGNDTALNFTGPSISGGQSYLSIYDKTPGDGAATRNLFDAIGGLQLSADVLFGYNGHSTAGGVVALYNEGQDALALLVHNNGGNNPDVPMVSLVWQSIGTGTTLTSVSLPAGTFVGDTNAGDDNAGDHWYRIVMDLSVSGDSYTINGSFFNHSNPENPNSDPALSEIPNSHLLYTGSLSSPGNLLDLTNPGEVGLMAMGYYSISLPDNVGVSITNFSIPTIPEPGSLLALGSFLFSGLGLMAVRRRK